MIRDLAIYGAGGLGREMAFFIHQINAVHKQWNLLGFFDDHKQESSVDLIPLLGGMNTLNSYKERISLLVGIADCAVKSRIVTKIINPNIEFPVFTHPMAQQGSESNQFGIGSILTSGCILTTGITIGNFVMINLLTTIGHDVKIGNFSSIMPSVNISGNVTMGSGVLVGTGATILQGLSIGDGAIIGAGSVVTKSVSSKMTVVGVPAREMKK